MEPTSSPQPLTPTELSGYDSPLWLVILLVAIVTVSLMVAGCVIYRMCTMKQSDFEELEAEIPTGKDEDGKDDAEVIDIDRSSECQTSSELERSTDI